MNIKANQYLRPIKFLIEKSGADFMQVAHLVDLKLLLDNRKKLPKSRGKSKDPKNSIFRQSIGYIVVGIFIILTLFRTNDPFFFIFTCQLMLMLMNTMTMLAEYSVSLFNTRDNNLILPLPANSQTVGWARVTHILLYLLLLSFSMMMPCVIFVMIKFTLITGILFFFSIFLTTLFTLFFTVFIYLALLKVTSGEKLKDVMMYLQVFFTIGIMLSYQIVPRYMSSLDNESLTVTKNWLYLIIPPAWFTSFSTIYNQFDKINIINSIVAITIPIIGISTIGKKLFYGFNDKLLEFDVVSSGKTKSKRHEVNSKMSWWFYISSMLVGVKKSETPLFKLMWKLSGRERLFKQSLLPILSYAVIMPVLISFTSGNLSNISSKYLPFLYFTILSSSIIPSILTIGNNKDAEWLYKILPNIQPADLFKATLKAALAKFFVPVFIIASLPLFYFKGYTAILDIICILIFNFMIASFALFYQTPYFAFTQEKSASQGGKTALKMFLIVFISLPLGFLHSFLIKKNTFYVLILIFVYALFLTLMNNNWLVKRYNWKYINSSNNQF